VKPNQEILKILIPRVMERKILSEEDWTKLIKIRVKSLKKYFRMLPTETFASKFGYDFKEINFAVNGKIVKSFNAESLFKERTFFSKNGIIQNIENNGVYDLYYWAINKNEEWLIIKISKKRDCQTILISLVELEEIFDEINDLDYRNVFENISECFSNFAKKRKKLYDEALEISQTLEFENSQIPKIKD